MKDLYIYIALPIIFVIVFHFFVNYKLYSQEKYKVGISLFIAFNVLLTGFIFIKQNLFHKEDITNEIVRSYDKLMDDLFLLPLKELSKKPDSKLFKSLFVNNIYLDADISNINVGTVDIRNISDFDINICLQILSSISSFSFFYYSLLAYDDYYNLLKNLNFRATKTISVYLHSPIFRTVLERYLNQFCGLGTKSFFKEFFNISQSLARTGESKIIAKSIIFDGKVDGKIKLRPVTTKDSTFFHIDKDGKDR
jgi:hypothetical protein